MTNQLFYRIKTKKTQHNKDIRGTRESLKVIQDSTGDCGVVCTCVWLREVEVSGLHREIYRSLSSVRRPSILKSPRRDWLPESFWHELIITCWDKLSSLHPAGIDFTPPHPFRNLVDTDSSAFITSQCNNVGQRGRIPINQCIWEIKDIECLIKCMFDLHKWIESCNTKL